MPVTNQRIFASILTNGSYHKDVIRCCSNFGTKQRKREWRHRILTYLQLIRNISLMVVA